MTTTSQIIRWSTAGAVVGVAAVASYEHRPHRTFRAAAPLHPLPEPVTDPEQIAHHGIRRRDRLGGILHEYQHAA